MAKTADWGRAARMFVATNRPQYLARAINACPDPEIREFLSRKELSAARPVLDRAISATIQRLVTEERVTEATLIQLLAYYPIALAADSPERFAPGVSDTATDICQQLADAANACGFPEIEARLVGALGVRAARQRDWPRARSRLSHALAIYRRLAGAEPDVYLPLVGATLNELGDVWIQLKQHSKAVQVAREVIETVEAEHGAPASFPVAKRRVNVAYRRWLDWLGTGESLRETPRVFRCLAAMREGHLRALDEDPATGLDAAAKALRQWEEQAGHPKRILIAQALSPRRTLLAVLSSSPTQPLIHRKTRDFVVPAETLFGEIARVFDETTRWPFLESRRRVRERGEHAWQCLPEEIRVALHPNTPGDVLISGDSFWSNFPWEALVLGPGEDDWLGLARPLVRRAGLSALAIQRIRQRIFGDGCRTASIFCPWDVPGQNALEAARDEAKQVEDSLARLAYQIEPCGRAVAGSKATPGMLESILHQRPALLHYTGHASVVNDEEVLLLWNEDPDSTSSTSFGGTELSDRVHRIDAEEPPWSNGPLVVLNRRRTEHARDHGRQHEDLPLAMLRFGAEAVVASSLPVLSSMGKTFASLFWTSRPLATDGLARHFAAARELTESVYRHEESACWAGWTMLHYHGNPAACLPHTTDDDEEPEADKLRVDTEHAVFEALKRAGVTNIDAVLKTVRDLVARPRA